MWESPRYTFEEDTFDKVGKIVVKPFYIDVTYSAPRNLDDPGKALVGVFKKITKGMDPEKTNVLDVGAGRLRNTSWFLQKGFQVWAIEFSQLKQRLPEAAKKWAWAERWGKKKGNFHGVTSPMDFISQQKPKFDLILLINIINVMPIPRERFALLEILRNKIKKKGKILWHQWRAKAIHPDKYTNDNAFLDGYIMGQGPNHSFYVEQSRHESHEMMYSVGFTFNKTENLHQIPGNSGHSYIFNYSHDCLITKALDVENMFKTVRKPNDVIKNVDIVNSLKMYLDELHGIPNKFREIPTGRKYAHKYHILASRIFFQIFVDELKPPITEKEIDEGRGRIDIIYRVIDRDGAFKKLRSIWKIHCPQVIVECKNYKNSLSNAEYNQLLARLGKGRGMLGVLLCRNKKDPKEVLKHCQIIYKTFDRYIIVLDDNDLLYLANLRLNQGTSSDLISDFLENEIDKIID
jgi:hypothetical protein